MILEEAGAACQGHFLLSSGKHSSKYMQCARIFQNSAFAEPLCKELAEKFKTDGVEIVIGPAIGAVQMAYEVARHLKVENCFAERAEGEFQFRRGFNIKKGMKCLLVEDVVTTGGSVLEVKNLVESMGGEVIGIGVIVDRSNGKAEKKFNTNFKSVIEMNVAQAYAPEECPLCKEGKIELVKPGSRPPRG